ncbi:hypothetical protein L6164_024596 [Bauhinia variegata]|uniref:Uncharacterized protein n=1 Tax=Bauhinia variegata TaxID=167791 RepID=A0ACB9LY11_BAUVA|nr:hypothetical protein L6164_024596 [Bauhinia variegata]
MKDNRIHMLPFITHLPHLKLIYLSILMKGILIFKDMGLLPALSRLLQLLIFLGFQVSGFCALLLAIGAALTFLNFSSPPVTPWFPDLVFTNCSDSDKMIITSRKLKESGSNITSNKRGDLGDVSLDDYRPIDPVPSSKALKPGPIEHGTPLNPFIPRPSPPPMFGDST